MLTTVSMKLAVFFVITLLSSLPAAEKSRTWTNVSGRTITGTLIAKDERAADILLPNGKRAKVSLKQLSKEDQNYVEAADVHPDVKMLATTRKIDSNANGTKKDARAIDVTLSEVHGRPYSVEVLWLGDTGDKNNYGIYKRQVQQTVDDGPLRFEVVYEYYENYRGWVAFVRDSNGVIIVKQASQKPFERFIPGSEGIPVTR